MAVLSSARYLRRRRESSRSMHGPALPSDMVQKPSKVLDSSWRRIQDPASRHARGRLGKLTLRGLRHTAPSVPRDRPMSLPS